MKYKVVEHWELGEFESQVNLLLYQGWTLQGGVSITIGPSGERILAQALIKE